jgi:hypothetical protein
VVVVSDIWVADDLAYFKKNRRALHINRTSFLSLTYFVQALMATAQPAMIGNPKVHTRSEIAKFIATASDFGTFTQSLSAQSFQKSLNRCGLSSVYRTVC